ncbi:MAG TPA: hypothetical protein VL400_20550, partial [Polyangiaceae bacterium]|nr:hypothetical protein [Polyangiaceae bacterium]
MTVKRAFAARAARARIEACVERLAKLAPAEEALVVGPSRVAVDELVFASRPKLGASFGVHRKTLFGLAVELAGPSLAAEGITLAPPLSIEAIARRVTRRALAAGRLAVLGRPSREGALPIASAPSFPLSVRATLGELRLAGIAPEALAATGTERELAALYVDFDAELERAMLADRSAVFERARREAAGSVYAGLALVVLDVPIRSIAEQRFLRALIDVASDAVVTTPDLDAATVEGLTTMGLSPERPPPARELAATERSVDAFRGRLFDDTSSGPLEDASGVALTSAADELLEAVEIARRCLEEARRGVPFDEMAVLVPPHGAYAAHLEAAFDRARIPAFFEVGTRRPHPGGRALLLLLRARLERGSGRRLGEYLASAQMPATPPRAVAEPALGDELEAAMSALGADDAEAEADAEADEAKAAELRIPFRRWERMLGELGVASAGVEASLADYVRKRIAVTRAELAARPEILAREAGDATDAPTAEAGRADDELDALRDLEERLVPLLGLLDRVPLRAPWAAHLAAIAELAPHAIRRPELALAILEELAVLASDDDPVDLAEVLAVIEPRLVSMERPPPRRGYGRVLVTRPVSMRGRARRVVILCGVGERIFPERVREDPLLLDRARKRLGGALATRHTR